MKLCRNGHERTPTSQGGWVCKTCRAAATAKRVKLLDCPTCGAIMEAKSVCGNEKNHASLRKWRAKAEELRKTSKLYVPGSADVKPFKMAP